MKEYRVSVTDKIKSYMREWRKENRPRLTEYNKAYDKANPGKTKERIRRGYQRNRDKHLERARQWQQENPERYKANMTKFYQKNAESVKAKVKQYRKDHPETDTKHRLAREYATLKNGGVYTAQEWFALCEKYGNVCLCCKQKKPLTADHVIPLSKGGTSDISNIQPLCLSCNSKKRTRYIDYR